jgi:maltose O-acetyltransferase
MKVLTDNGSDDVNGCPMPYAEDAEFCREWMKMLRGEVYEAAHPCFHKLLARTRSLMREFNDARPDDMETQRRLLREIFGSVGDNLHVNQPLRVDYGCNIRLGHDVFVNFNLTVLDEGPVTIGNHVFIGPNVSIYTACHPVDPEERRDGREWAEPVTIGNDVWIGGGATILPGVTIGDGSVVAAASVVSRDVPPRTVVAGSPARPIRKV